MSAFRTLGRAALYGNVPVLVCSALAIAAGYAGELGLGLPGLMRDLWQGSSFTYLVVFLLLPLPLVLLVGRLAVRDSRGRFVPGVKGWRRALTQFHADFTRPVRLVRAATAAVAIALIINVYGSWKRALTTVRPFSWDERLADLDRGLHLGVDPWRLLQPWVGTPSATLALDTVYYTWLPITFATMGWLVWSRQDGLRGRALVGLAVVWIGLGNVMAMALSSAGPAFYAHLVPGPDPFAPLIRYLQETALEVSLFAPELQQTLWRLHVTGTTDIYTGISAMPSVHVAVPALYACAGWERNRWLGVGFGFYTLLILLATVHLGWHYAIDGYLAIVAVGVYWWVARLAAKRAA